MTGARYHKRLEFLRRPRSHDREIHPVLLRFPDPELDRQFREEHDAAAVPQMIVAGYLALLLYAAFGALDPLVGHDNRTWVLVIRYAIVCPYIAVVIVFATFSDRWRRHAQLAVCSVVVVASYGLDAMPLVAPELPPDYARTGSLLVLMFLYAFARVRFWWAMGTTLVVVTGFQVSFVLQGTPWVEAYYANFWFISFIIAGSSASYTLERLRRKEFLRERALEDERARSDTLLHNILPEEIAARLRNEPAAIAEAAEEVSVLFADIVGFTPFSESLPPHEVVALLDGLFTVFDDLCDQHGVEKIKTIGDAYMAVAGIPRPDPDHAASMAELALDMQSAAGLFARHWPGPLALRIGISSGPVVAGVIGHRKFAYDLWGDTVNTASRMESHAVPGRIQVSATTHALLRDRYAFGERQVTTVKGKGEIDTYLLRGRNLDVSDSEAVAAVR